MRALPSNLRLDRLDRLAGRVSRRALLRSGAAGMGTAALAAAGVAAAPAPPAGPAVREFVLTAAEFDWRLMDDTAVRAWGYDGQVPGPELRVTEGDTVRVTLVNRLPVPTTVHWHGVRVPNAMDGVAGLNQAPVEPGAQFVYEFVAAPAGTRWYHSHTDPALQVPLGLYGPLIVEPRAPAEAYDREQTLVLAEWDDELTPAVASGRAGPGPGDARLRGGELGADQFLINGRMHGAVPPIRIATGERLLLRLIHAGAIPHPIHVHGHSFAVVATDGNPVPAAARLTKDTILIAPAERYDLAIVGDNPGVWMVHCHIEHHMANGMMTTLWYDGYEPTGPVAAAAGALGDGVAAMPAGMDMGTAAPTPSPTATATRGPDASAAAGPGGTAAEVAMVDDRFDPSVLTIAVGTTVTWTNDGRNWHSVAAFDGSFESGRIGPGERFAHRFDAPGEYQYLCKHHGLQGMVGQVTVK